MDGATPVILIVLEDARHYLHFLVDPNWRGIVQAVDLEYLESLFADFLERSKDKPEELFKQCLSLEVGPLVTRETGERISDHPSLLAHTSRFVNLRNRLL